MTPAAITPAGRASTKKKGTSAASDGGARAGSGETTGHPRALRRRSAPSVPRRVSGPVRGRLADALAPRARPAAPNARTAAPRARTAAPGARTAAPGARTAAPGARTAAPGARTAAPGARTAAPGTRPATTRRGLITPRARPARRSATARSSGLPLSARAVAFVRGLPDHPLLDRLIRGRAWIPLLGVMLAGIVAMQVEVLKLGASMGRSIEQGATLQSRNDQLRLAVAALDSDERIERLAAASGMIMPAPDAVGFLSRSSSLVPEAIANIHEPDVSTFLSAMTSNGAIATVADSQPTSPSSIPAATSTGTASTASTQAPGASTTQSTSLPQQSPASSQTTPSSAQTGSAAPSQTSVPAQSAGTTQSSAPTQPPATTQTSSAGSSAGSAQGSGTSLAATPAGSPPSQSGSASGGAGIPAGG